MALRELLAHFDISVDTKQLKNAGEHIEHTIESLKKFGEVAVAAFAANELVNFATEMIHAASETFTMSQRLGITTEELEKFEYAAKMSGATAEDAATALRFLNRNLGQAVGGSDEAVKSFTKLGVSQEMIKRGNTTEIAIQMANGIQKLGTQGERTAAAMKLLGRGGVSMIPLLQQGGQAVEDTFKDFEELTQGIGKELPEAAHKAQQQLVRYHTVMEVIKKQMTLAILPAFTDVVTKVTLFASHMSQAIQKSNLGKVALVALGVGAAIAAVYFLALNLPMVLLVVGILAAIAVIEDIYTLFSGGDSFTGRFIDSIAGVGASKKYIKELKDSITELGVEFGLISNKSEGAGEVMKQAFFAAGRVIKGVVEDIIVTLEWMIDKIVDAVVWLKNMGKHVSHLLDTANGKTEREDLDMAVNATPSLSDRFKQVTADYHAREPMAFQRDNASPAAGAPMSITNKVEIHTGNMKSDDPNFIAKLGENVMSQLGKANEKAVQKMMQDAKGAQFRGAAAK